MNLDWGIGGGRNGQPSEKDPAAWFPEDVPHAWFVFYGDDLPGKEDFWIWCMNPTWKDEEGYPSEMEL